MSTLSMKTKIYLITFMLLALMVLVGAVGIFAMHRLNTSVDRLKTTAERLSNIDDIKAYLQAVLIEVREIIISTDENTMDVQTARLHKIIDQELEPRLAEFGKATVMSREFTQLTGLWQEHKAIVAEILAATRANTTERASRLSRGPSYEFWREYEKRLTDVVAACRENSSPVSTAAAFKAEDSLKTVLKMEIQEKLAILWTSDSKRLVEEGRKGLDDIAKLVQAANVLERLLTNPAVSDAELKSFNDAYAARYIHPVFNVDDTVTYSPTAANAPATFIHPELEKASRLYWEQYKPMRLAGPTFYRRVSELAAENSNGKASVLLETRCNPTRKAELELVDTVMHGNERFLREAKESAQMNYNWALTLLFVVGGTGLAAGLFLSISTVTRITRTLSTTIDELASCSSTVDSVSAQIATASEALADGATEQAASLEETSSALEQMASMTRQNADNAGKTSEATNHTIQLIDNGATRVSAVTGAMDEINDSAGKISQIIKTIQEIAFQTNLLALNAAVEAARAGEAGKGFAVVADEVRNLAQRSAQAAKDTAELIEGTVNRVRNGSENVAELATGFKEIENRGQNVGRLITEITSATHEQAQGVDQINTAVAQMDKVTQNNAAASEESASAAAELSEESSRLNSLVGDLRVLVYGGDDTGRSTRASKAKPAASATRLQYSTVKPVVSAARQLPLPAPSSRDKARRAKPQAALMLTAKDDNTL